MSLLGTLAKVAIGIAVAKGVGSMMNRGKQGQTQSPDSGGGLGDVLEQLGGGAQGGARQQQSPGSGGGLGDILEQLGGGASKAPRKAPPRRQGGGLGDLLEQLGGGAGGGGLGDLLGQLGQQQSGRSSGNGGASDQLGDVFGDFIKDAKPGNNQNGSFGDIFNQSLDRGGEPEVAPSREQEIAAALMLRAMIQAAKSDGKVDEGERQKLLENLGDVSAAERRFVEQEFAKPIDVAGLARQVPRGLEQQVYLMSVMGINLDNRQEAQYLHDLATEMDISHAEVNGIHDHLGIPRIYS